MMVKLVSDMVDTKIIKTKKKDKNLPTKLVIRRLPPCLTKEDLQKQLEPIPPHDYFEFVEASYSFGREGFTRAYINFDEYNDIFEFRNKFDGFLFYDAQGHEYSAVVECAPCQQTPRSKKKVDLKSDTIDKDPDYMQFLENFEKEETYLPSAEVYIEELQAMSAIDKKKEKVRTPLIDFLKEKRDTRIAARQAATAQREKERKTRAEREKRKERERKGKYDKTDRKPTDSKVEKRDSKKDVTNEEAKENESPTKSTSENEKHRSTDHPKSAGGKSGDSKKDRASERKYRNSDKEDRTHGRYYDDRYYDDKRKSREKDHKRGCDASKDRTKVREVEDIEKGFQRKEQRKNEEERPRKKSVVMDDPSIIAFEESKEDSVSKKATRKARPEMKFYRPPSERSSRSIKDDKRDIERNKADKTKTHREKHERSARRYDKPERSFSERKTTSLSKDLPYTVDEHEKLSNRPTKSDAAKVPRKNEKSEEEKELERERYRLNWLGTE